jgi:type II secretory pathway pseudopilin PulG
MKQLRNRHAYVLGDKKRVRDPSRRRFRKVVVLIIGLLTISYILWAMEEIDEQTRRKQALLDISRIQHAARLFRADFGRCPSSLDELVSPPGSVRYLIHYRDPWGQPYKLTCPARNDPGGVEVVSGGPDSSFSGNDTISSL